MIKGKPPRLSLIHIDQPLYFVTFCTLHRRPWLANNPRHEALKNYCLHGVDHNVGVGRYVIMPDHVHLFVQGDMEFDLGVWQPGFFDHILRSDESYAQKWDYVRENPVRANLVTTSDAWPFQGEITVIDRA